MFGGLRRAGTQQSKFPWMIVGCNLLEIIRDFLRIIFLSTWCGMIHEPAHKKCSQQPFLVRYHKDEQGEQDWSRPNCGEQLCCTCPAASQWSSPLSPLVLLARN